MDSVCPPEALCEQQHLQHPSTEPTNQLEHPTHGRTKQSRPKKKVVVKKTRKVRKPRTQSQSTEPGIDSHQNAYNLQRDTVSPTHHPQMVEHGWQDAMADTASVHSTNDEGEVSLRIPFNHVSLENESHHVELVRTAGNEIPQNDVMPQAHDLIEVEPSLDSASTASRMHEDRSPPRQPVQAPNAPALHPNGTPTEANGFHSVHHESVQMIATRSQTCEQEEHTSSHKVSKKQQAHHRSSSRNGCGSYQKNRSVNNPLEQHHQVVQSHGSAKVTKCQPLPMRPTIEMACKVIQSIQASEKNAHEAVERRCIALEEALQNASKELSTVRENLGGVTTQLNGLKVVEARLESMLQAANKSNKSLESTIETTKSQLKEAEERLNTSGEKLKKSKDECELLRKYNKGLKNDKVKLEEDSEALAKEYQGKVDDGAKLLQEAKERNDALDRDLEQRVEAVKELQRQLEAAKNAHSQRLADIDTTLKQQKATNDESLQKLLDLATKTNARELASSEDMQKLNTQLDAVKSRSLPSLCYSKLRC